MKKRDFLHGIFPEEHEIPGDCLIEAPIRQNRYLVNGQMKTWNGAMQDVYSPVYIKTSSGSERKYLGSYPLLNEEESLKALDAAVNAYKNGRGMWPTMSVSERIGHVETFVYKMKEKRDEVVRLLMWEICKSRKDSEKEFDRTVKYIVDTIEALKDLDRVSSRFVIEEGILGQIRRAPLGVALCMGPFNYPLNETFTTLIPALIMGNTVIFKPAKYGVLLWHPLLEVFRDAFPPGVVNMIYGDGKVIVSPLLKSGKIDVLAFIGSSRVADILKMQHPKPHRMRCVLGLEAKNAAIVLPDADLDLAVSECLLGSLSYNGQRCTALKMLFLHSKICMDFISKFVKGLEQLKIGMPWDDGVSITPLAEENKSEYLTGLIREAKDLGAEVKNEGGGEFNYSVFIPAVLYPVDPKTRLFKDEQFGPVVPICSFDDIEEPVQFIIDSDYGQQVSIFGSNSDVMANLIDPLVNQVCRVNINSQCQRGPDTFPFTGRKDSAEGTLSVSDALRVFTIRTLVAAKEKDLNKKIITDIVRNHKSNFLSTNFIL